MKKTGNDFVDGNVVYPSAWFQEGEPKLKLVEMSPEQRKFMENCLLGEVTAVIHRERYNPLKRLRQVVNRYALNTHKDEIVASGPVRIIHPEENIVDKLDQQLTDYSNNYVWNIAQGFVSAYGFESHEFDLFASELLHPKELERYRYNIEDHEFRGGSHESRVNWGIALVVNRRFLPYENVERYFKAKKLFDEKLEESALDSYKEYMEYIETKIYENPLFHYVVAHLQKNASRKNPRSTDLF